MSFRLRPPLISILLENTYPHFQESVEEFIDEVRDETHVIWR